MIFAFTAGLISFFSPCAFPMLPGYISYYIGIKKQNQQESIIKISITKILMDGVLGGLVCATGAIFVFVLFGIGVSFFVEAIRNVLRKNIILINPFIGIILILMGILLLKQKNFSFLPKIKMAPKKKGYLGLFSYGILYSLVAAGCVAPLFVGVIARAFTSSTFLEGILVFLPYALGLAVLFIAVTLLIVSARETIVRKMNHLLPHIQKIGAIILIIVGIWVIYTAIPIIL